VSRSSQGSQCSQGNPDHLPLDLLVIDEVAALLRCSTKTIRRRVHEGRLKYITAASNRLLFRRVDIAALLSSEGPGQSSSNLRPGAARDGTDGLGAIASDLAG
jgi:excisionase family DNA binding protein